MLPWNIPAPRMAWMRTYSHPAELQDPTCLTPQRKSIRSTKAHCMSTLSMEPGFPAQPDSRVLVTVSGKDS